MKFQLGQYVEVTCPDHQSGYIEDYIGAIGKIIGFSIETVGGSENDPEISAV